MNIKEFKHRVKAGRLKSRAVDGALMVLVKGISRNEAARLTGVNLSCVSRMAKQISEMEVCEHCRQVK